MIPVTNKFIRNALKKNLKMQGQAGMALELVSPCVSLKVANPYSSNERCYKLPC